MKHWNVLAAFGDSSSIQTNSNNPNGVMTAFFRMSAVSTGIYWYVCTDQINLEEDGGTVQWGHESLDVGDRIVVKDSGVAQSPNSHHKNAIHQLSWRPYAVERTSCWRKGGWRQVVAYDWTLCKLSWGILEQSVDCMHWMVGPWSWCGEWHKARRVIIAKLCDSSELRQDSFIVHLWSHRLVVRLWWWIVRCAALDLQQCHLVWMAVLSHTDQEADKFTQQ